MDSDDLATREEVRKRVERDAVIGIIEGGNEHDSVRDVEIAVAGGQALPLEHNRRGHGQLDNLERPALEVAGGPKTVEVLSQRDMVFVGAIGFCNRDDYIF